MVPFHGVKDSTFPTYLKLICQGYSMLFLDEIQIEEVA
jgi:hypothetical protein